MGCFDSYMPAIAMIGLQFSYAAVALFTRAALLQGISPRVLIVYRQAISALVVGSTAYLLRRKSGGCPMGMKSFSLIFLSAFVGIAVNQNIYFEGVFLASSSMASAMTNLVPAITFTLATIVGLEKVNIRSLRSIAKIFGTIFCVGGAVCMVLLKGSKLLNSEILPIKSLLGAAAENWLLGCLLLFASSCLWAVWLILQVPTSASYPDHVSLAAWMCFMAAMQAAIIPLVFERDLQAWNVPLTSQVVGCLLSGLLGSGVSVFIQAWVISLRGPVFVSMFSPLCTIIVTILAAIFLQEEIYTGSLVGAVAVVIGLYVVLWGKAKDVKPNSSLKQQNDQKNTVEVLVDESSKKTSLKIDLNEPLLED